MRVFFTPFGGNITDVDLGCMPTLAVGHFSNLKMERDGYRVWLSRMTASDYAPGPLPKGWPFEFEKLVEGRWVPCDNFGDPL